MERIILFFTEGNELSEIVAKRKVDAVEDEKRLQRLFRRLLTVKAGRIGGACGRTGLRRAEITGRLEEPPAGKVTRGFHRAICPPGVPSSRRPASLGSSLPLPM